MTETHYLEALHRELALALGDAVWSFAKIEWLTYEALGRLSPDAKLGEVVGDVSFKGRTGMLRRLVERGDATEDKKKRAREALAVVDDLANQRNIIVHNPWRIWANLDEKEFMTEIQKYSNSGRKLDLAQLRRFLDDATVAEIKLREALRALK